MKTTSPFAVLLGASLITWAAFVSANDIKHDEYIQFARGIATLNKDGLVEGQITAWVYEKESRPGAKQLFATFAGFDVEAMSERERSNFDNRTQLFRFDSEHGKQITLHLSPNKTLTLPATDSDGITRAQLTLAPLSELSVIQTPGAAPVIDYHAVLPANDNREFNGQLLLVPETGVSVVSDIDDTIKDSNVRNRTELLNNTFVRDFRAVAGMAERYGRFAAENTTVRFHYLSSSPHQLYPAIDEFLQGNGFPVGSLHLRYLDVSDELFGNGDSSRRQKLNTLQQLLQQFPQRRFLLIGDSGEADPEIYAETARRFPQQVLAIYIRDVTGEPATAARYRDTFAGLPAGQWQIFTEPGSLPAIAPLP
ncbi:App1 family protein [Permianibacter sp. IMCC34836]|uniref:phosphatidate phosphatase App1 family protein n=1 Tax=Permianibacter fluminis TaxID=2738515 RepID=UPI001557DCCD|nr:App1 family protein [Permianibacter fluminis]NQD35938.1 App1 family protein [Permianibacter fluminis]